MLALFGLVDPKPLLFISKLSYNIYLLNDKKFSLIFLVAVSIYLHLNSLYIIFLHYNLQVRKTKKSYQINHMLQKKRIYISYFRITYFTRL